MKHHLSTLAMLAILVACSPSQSPSDAQNASTNASANTAEESIFNYKEKLDAFRLAMALQKSGMQNGQQKEAEWNQKLAAAKNNADIQAVFRDQAMFYRQAQTALQSLNMYSEQGKQIHGQMLRGFSGMVQVLGRMQSLNLDTPEGMVQANQLQEPIKNHATDIMQSMQAWINMMKANGFEPDAAKEAEFEQKVQELQQEINK